MFEKYVLLKSCRKIKNNQEESGAGKTLMMVNFEKNKRKQIIIDELELSRIKYIEMHCQIR